MSLDALITKAAIKNAKRLFEEVGKVTVVVLSCGLNKLTKDVQSHYSPLLESSSVENSFVFSKCVMFGVLEIRAGILLPNLKQNFTRLLVVFSACEVVIS